jgi:hypothetical protein
VSLLFSKNILKLPEFIETITYNLFDIGEPKKMAAKASVKLVFLVNIVGLLMFMLYLVWKYCKYSFFLMCSLYFVWLKLQFLLLK